MQSRLQAGRLPVALLGRDLRCCQGALSFIILHHLLLLFLLARSASQCRAEILKLCSADVTYFHRLYLGDQLPQKVLDRSSSNFQDRYIYGCSHMIAHALLWQLILAQIDENLHTPPSFCALSFHSGWEDRNMDARVNTADDPSASFKNSVNFGPVTPEFAGTFCAGRSTRWALPRI